ncbi:hypothetical protein T1I15_08250 [Lactiplantibacillus plantarum]|nr:hypothetical protein T1I15_08250 [Lactiplantibacillus plantarum]
MTIELRTSIPSTLDLLNVISARLCHLLTTTKSLSVDLTSFGKALISRCRLVCVFVDLALVELLVALDVDWLAPQPARTPANDTNARPLNKFLFNISLAAFLISA